MMKKTLLLPLFVCFFSACGKKVTTTDSPLKDPVREEQTAVPEEIIKKHFVSCGVNQRCPSYIAKVLSVNAGKLQVCTGFLVKDDIIITSGSCIPDYLRLKNQSCSKDIFFLFPQTSGHSFQRVGCKKVKLISELYGEDPLLWRDNVAALELERPLTNRRPTVISRQGILNSRPYYSWMVHQEDQFSGIIKRVYCEGVHDSYVNPLAVSNSSPGSVLSNCQVADGGLGAPILDFQGKVRALTVANLEDKLKNYLNESGLLTKSLDPMIYATNFACAPTIDDDDLLDEKECLKDLTYEKVEKKRGEMLSFEFIFEKQLKNYREQVSELSRYLLFDIKFLSTPQELEAKIFPKCFRSLEGWLPYFRNSRNKVTEKITIPIKTFQRTLNSKAQVQSKVFISKTEKKYVQFSLKTLRSKKYSQVVVWDMDDYSEGETYSEMSEKCPRMIYEDLMF